MKVTRFIPALVLALVLAGGAVSQAQIICTIPCPVWDFSAILKNIAINVLKGQINAKLTDQDELFAKMGQRLAKLTPLSKYAIEMDETPEWRIHDWFTGFNRYSNDFLQALTYGDASGSGFDSVAQRRENPNESKFLALSGEAQAALGADSALIDIVDSAVIRGTHETGRLRFNGRAEAEAIRSLQELVTDSRDEDSATAVADKISAGALVEAQNKQAKIQFQAALLEQLLVGSVRARNAAARAANMQFNQMEDDGRMGREGVARATETLQNWRLP
jgi:hypothetical protein